MIHANYPCLPEAIGMIRGRQCSFRSIPYLVMIWRTARMVGFFNIFTDSDLL